MNICRCFLLLFCILSVNCLHAQSDSLEDSIPSKPVSIKYVDKVSGKAGQLNTNLDKQTTRLLKRWKKQEEKIYRKLARKDSLNAASLLSDSKQQYEQLEQKIESKTSLQQYIPELDTISSSIKFLQQNSKLLANTKDAKEKLSKALLKVKGLETQFQKAEDVKSYLRQRRQHLKEQLIQPGFGKELKKLNKQTYYYSAHLKEYKSLLKDHKKAERKALELLSKTNLFKNFMRKHSNLASLFRLPGDPNDPIPTASLSGLQTRAQVSALIQQQIAAGGPNAQQQIQQNIQAAQSQLNQLKEKLLKIPSGGEDLGDVGLVEGFRPSSQKVKSFWRRIEVGTNIQSQKANEFLPTQSDLGLSLGYKLNDKSTIGIGGSYRVGWGKDIRHINITHQGMSIRSYLDYKIKGSFWLSGAYEMNYRSEFKNIDQLKHLDGWQQSGLVGLSKVVSLKTKFFKKTRLMLAWDFLSYREVPKSQPVLFRVGYNF